MYNETDILTKDDELEFLDWFKKYRGRDYLEHNIEDNSLKLAFDAGRKERNRIDANQATNLVKR